MKSKINIQFMLVTGIAIAMTLVMTTFVFYRLFEQEVMNDLESCANFVKEILAVEGIDEEALSVQEQNVRITIVNKDGSVIYDSYADIASMDNHKNRPEIKDALKKGVGKSIRKSSTVEKSNFYYAIQLKNGKVLRVAKETGSIWSVYKSSFPVIVLIAIILFGVCVFLSHFLTKSLISPIEQMAVDMDHLEKVSTYKELMPFITLIRTQHEDILKSAQMRQEFTANVSHELKTPLTSISGYSELIENGMATEENVTRFASEIHRNSKRLLKLINDIIKLSELDVSAEYEMYLEDVDLYTIAENCVLMLEPSAAKHGVELSITGEHTVISANKDLMEELVYNLCDNAIRYNHVGGHVKIDVSRQLVVKDDGIGISKENQQRIFERFFRVDKSRSKKTGGTGLGLAIVKHIVELHDASLEMVSEEGKGTEITVKFDK